MSSLWNSNFPLLLAWLISGCLFSSNWLSRGWACVLFEFFLHQNIPSLFTWKSASSKMRIAEGEKRRFFLACARLCRLSANELMNVQGQGCAVRPINVLRCLRAKVFLFLCSTQSSLTANVEILTISSSVERHKWDKGNYSRQVMEKSSGRVWENEI